MLLTHAKYAFKDPRGRFGISDSARPDASGNRQRVEIRLGHKALVLRRHKPVICSGRGRSFVLLRCAVIASTEQPPFRD